MNGNDIIRFLNDNYSTVLSGVKSVTGALLTVVFLRHNTSAVEFEKIKAGHFKEVTDELLKSGKLTNTEYYKTRNYLKIAKIADETFQDNHKDNIIKNYSFDWFFRFFDSAGNVNDETMQIIWAKILAGEIASPGTFSLKTIDVLRNIGKSEAELFVKTCSHSFVTNYGKSGLKQVFIPNSNNFMERIGITYSDVMKLNELGLMFNDSTIGWKISINNVPQVLFINNDLVMMISSTKNKNELINIKSYPFTCAGTELATLIGKNASDDDFIEFGRIIRSNNIKIQIHKINSLNDNTIDYEKDDLLS